ncbi:hypothetical protein Taro_012328 [Colocasia esculenta]|uniref:Uncharacterized protein n=1 Tax=Colocasia esculenta TaxID=4460 RepID=A0A843U8F1_COLES|nr:hypothetical protein [Colocasia esculenta]
MASSKALMVLGLLLAALLCIASSGVVFAEEQVTIMKKAEQQHSAGGSDAVEYGNNKGAAAGETRTSRRDQGNNVVGEDQRGRCRCCGFSRIGCFRRCCPDGQEILV